MAENYVNNSIYASNRGGKNYEDSVYSGGRKPSRSVYSAKTGASAYSHITKKSSDFYRTDAISRDRVTPLGQRVADFIWNPQERTVFGKTWDSWLRTMLYHLVLYAVVAVVWAAGFALFDFAVLMEDKPTLTGKHSALQLNPSLSFFPQPDHYTTLIRFRNSRMGSIRKYADDIVAITQWYEEYGLSDMPVVTETLMDCSKTGVNPDPLNVVCKFNLDVARRCNAYKNFGFADGDPCIALKLNRVYGWVPDPEDTGANATTGGVRVTCRGRQQSDQDFIGNICYHYTSDGDDGTEEYCKSDFGVFEQYYFPYLRQMRYMSPLVFVEFQGVTKNVVVMVECEAYAKNIKVDSTYRIGKVQFELLVD